MKTCFALCLLVIAFQAPAQKPSSQKISPSKKRVVPAVESPQEKLVTISNHFCPLNLFVY